MAEKKRGLRKSRIGEVVSDRMDKTVVVQVTRIVMHPLYKKYIRKRAKYKAHDERGEYRVGDTVQIVETKPLSKEKRWRVSKLIERPEIK
ncbi:MAG: 30S ribosomal protein S17 [Deltaproteobacteria bacterium]|nr:30S ribosomal protein S17 [Deltaproteobacteria bacterium]NIS77015.1 30S ribosomal protein S17 [Deltaproteobacteria bacterium]